MKSPPHKATNESTAKTPELVVAGFSKRKQPIQLLVNPWLSASICVPKVLFNVQNWWVSKLPFFSRGFVRRTESPPE